jgi:hypothetical protein
MARPKKPKTRLTGFAKSILSNTPSSGIGERTLLEKCGGMSGYSDYQKMIGGLVNLGYLKPKRNGDLHRTNKRDKAIGK